MEKLIIDYFDAYLMPISAIIIGIVLGWIFKRFIHQRLKKFTEGTEWKGDDVRLTVTEFLILKDLAQRTGIVKTRDQLMDAAYGETIYVDDRTIDSHIKRLRKKFRLIDKKFDQIETLYGVGYRYREKN